MEKLYKECKLGGYMPEYFGLVWGYFYFYQLEFGSKNIGN